MNKDELQKAIDLKKETIVNNRADYFKSLKENLPMIDDMEYLFRVIEDAADYLKSTEKSLYIIKVQQGVIDAM